MLETRSPTQLTQIINDQPLSSRQIPENTKSAFVQWRRVRTVSDSEEYQFLHVPPIQERWYDWIVEIFKKPDAEKLAYREYEEARRTLLQCQRMRDYYENMVKFESQRIRRLRKILQIDGG